MVKQLRDYQQQALSAMQQCESGRHAVVVPTGGGKTVIFTSYINENKGRALILSHRSELVRQPLKYLNCSYAIEQGKEHSDHTEKVTSATVQTMVRRLDKFSPNEYDTIIIDECFTGDTEILTENGFVRFDELKDEKVAQFNEDFTISFCVPTRKIVRQHSGDMVNFQVYRGKSFLMTPNHNQPLYSTSTNLFTTETIEKTKLATKKIVTSGIGIGYKEKLSFEDRLFIMLEADGNFVREKKDGSQTWHIAFSKQRKKDRFKWICDNLNIKYSKSNDKDVSRERWVIPNVNVKCSKNLSDHFKLVDMSYDYARDFINEICLWDGSYKCGKSGNPYYCETRKNNVDFVNCVAILAGYTTYTSTEEDNRKPTYNAIHRLYMSDNLFRSTQRSKKTTTQFNGTVYCVEVPSHMIVVRREGVTIVSGNCHHSSADTYVKILDYFKPRVTFGFSATIRRADGKSLQGVFNDIIFERNILYMIKQGYLCNIECRRVYLDFDLSSVKTSNGDYNATQLDEAMKGTEQGVVEAYKQYARGQTIIFCESVRQATEITSLLGDIAFVVTGTTPKEEREQLIKDFHDKKYKVAVNCAVFTEGYDEPAIETVIMASPTKSQTKFIQCAGRGMRLYEGKEKMLLIDICGASSCGMMTAPSLLGIDIDKVPPEKQKKIEGDLLELEEVVEELSDCPASWIKNTKLVDLWGKANGIDTLSLNFFQLPDGRMVVSLPERKKIVIPPMDITGNCNAREIKGISSELLQWGLKTYGEQWEYQRAINCARAELERNYGSVSMVWDLKKTKSWGNKEPTEAQMKSLNRRLKGETPENLTRFEASQILNRLNCK